MSKNKQRRNSKMKASHLLGSLILKSIGMIVFVVIMLLGCSKDDKNPVTPPKTKGETIKDLDGNTYKIVKIGDQWWMAENLKVKRYRNGDVIPHVIDGEEWKNLTSGAYYECSNDVNHVTIYGRIYNWAAVNDSRMIAPTGWHVPSDEEWKQLEMYLGMSQSEADKTAGRGTNEGGKLKETGNTHWQSPNSGATNESGFSALPGGWIGGGSCGFIGSYGIFWTSTEIDSNSAWMRSLSCFSSWIIREENPKKWGFYIRCVKD
jgi:uncharacterized protein (TIGR02145 family)